MSLPLDFNTERMNFRLLNLSDIEFIQRQFSDPDMCKYFSDPPCDLKEAENIIVHYQDPEGKGYLRYGMFELNTGSFIGTCGYHFLDQQLKQVEIGYDIWKDYWRQGYLSEALPHLITICFEHLDVECIYILTHPDNKASQASAHKFGLRECIPCRITDENPKCMKLMKADWC